MSVLGANESLSAMFPLPQTYSSWVELLDAVYGS